MIALICLTVEAAVLALCCYATWNRERCWHRQAVRELEIEQNRSWQKRMESKLPSPVERMIRD
jgi:hypothetical protein